MIIRAPIPWPRTDSEALDEDVSRRITASGGKARAIRVGTSMATSPSSNTRRWSTTSRISSIFTRLARIALEEPRTTRTNLEDERTVIQRCFDALQEWLVSLTLGGRPDGEQEKARLEAQAKDSGPLLWACIKDGPFS